MSELYDIFRRHPRISTDTRRIEPGSVFFALHGATFDGNRFAADALSKGAAYAVVDDPAAVSGDRTVLVGDTLEALQELAREHRRELAIPILAISGSNGKTTTKELVSRVLAERFEVYATHGNLNNHIGVPLTLLAMTRDTEFGVVEMGASACGELALLASVAEPNYGILTNIGLAHLEGFGGPEGVRRGKGELFDFLAANGGHAFVPADDEILTGMAAERDSLAAEYYSASLADGIENHLEGSYNRFNIAAAVAVGHYFDVPDERIRHAIASYVPDNNRSQRMQTDRNTLIVDCYNANPSSMHASVGNFLAEPLGGRSRRVLILGDMLELGAWSEEEHRQVILQAAQDPAAELLLVGGEFARAYASLPEPRPAARLYPSCTELAEALAAAPLHDALILVKASRGILTDRNGKVLVSNREAILGAWGQIDILLNAAGGNMGGATIAPDKSFLDLEIEAFRKVVDLNLFGTVLPTTVFGEAMTARRKGVIVNFCSESALRPLTRVVGYGAAKAAIANYTKYMAAELAMKFSSEMRVNAIVPGFLLTNQNRTLLTNPDGSYTQRGQDVIRQTPFGRMGEPEELCGTIHYLMSDAAKFVTGTVAVVDGGFNAFAM